LGRQRHPLKILLFQLLTLGIYGRVYLYKILREFDGHEALFLDRRPYIPLLILPFVGPLLVKRKITAILVDLIHHDVTTPRFKPRRLGLFAWIPFVPLFHMDLQRVLNHHWSMHRKELELELKRTQLATLERSRAAESVKAAQLLAKEVTQREKELDDVRQAAIALREAEQVRLEAERGAGRRRSPMALVRKLSAAAAARLPRRGGAQTVDEEQVPFGSDAATREPVGRGRKAQPEPEPEPESEPDVEPEPEDVEPAPAEEDVSTAQKTKGTEETAGEPAPKKRWMSFVPFLGKKSKEPSDKPVEATKPEKKGPGRSFLGFLGKKSGEKPDAKDATKGKAAKGGDKKDGLSRAERKALKQKEKEKAKAAKVAANEKAKAAKVAAKEKAKAAKVAAKAKKHADKAAAKEAKRAEKDAAKEANANAKAEKKAAKEEAKAQAKAAKERAKAAEKKKGKSGGKKEKPAAKPGAKAKGGKPKVRSK